MLGVFAGYGVLVTGLIVATVASSPNEAELTTGSAAAVALSFALGVMVASPAQ